METIKTFLPEQLFWPDRELAIFNGTHTLCYEERKRIAIFLVGNGCGSDDIYVAFEHRLGNSGNHAHFKSLVAGAMGTTYDQQWSYFDLRQQDYLFLSGEVCAKRRPPAAPRPRVQRVGRRSESHET